MRSAAAPPPLQGASSQAGGRQAPPPKDAWLNAIMSKPRSPPPVPWGVSASASGRTSGAVESPQWRLPRPSGAPPPTALDLPLEDSESDRHEQLGIRHVQDRWLVEACAQQAGLDESALRKAFSVAVQAMVDEQDCCFIAKGLCHLCGVSENHFVPVVNFCPDANAGHSLCREHLRSIYRVRTEDLFAGRNRPMASRRALKCMVCSRTCPCSMCVLEKSHEVNRYRRWLREEQELARSSNGLGDSGSRPDSSQRLENQGSDQSGEYYSGETALSMQAEGKAAASNRGPKRSAKESLPPLRLPSMESKHQPPSACSSSHSSSESGRGRLAGVATSSAPVPSPSASHVINCAESEKSLVQLLTTLNQSTAGDHATPEAKAHRPYEGGARDATPAESKEQQKLIVDTRLAASDADDRRVSSTRASERSAKRKRVVQEQEDSVDEDDDDDEYELVESPGGTLSSSRSGRASRKPREDYSSVDDAPLWSPRASKEAPRGFKPSGRKPGRPKKADSANIDEGRASLKVSPSSSSSSSATRKRKSSNSELDTAVASDRKNPRASKPSPPKHSMKHAKAARIAAKGRSGAQTHRHHQDADEEESDIDTNLDYCEVCLAMGDLVCCDVCPRSFHLACLGMKERDLPEGDWQCDECKKPSHFEAFARKVDIQPGVFTKCAQIIKCLKEHPFAKPFATPVGDIPNYREIVQQPMDLSTVASKLKRNAYAVGSATKGLNLDAFANDVRLIWANCKLFNDDGSGITRAAAELAAGFEKLLNQVKKKLPPSVTAVAPAPVSTEAEGHETRVDPQAEPSPGGGAKTEAKPLGDGEKTVTDKAGTDDQSTAASTEPTAPSAAKTDESAGAIATASAADEAEG